MAAEHHETAVGTHRRRRVAVYGLLRVAVVVDADQRRGAEHTIVHEGVTRPSSQRGKILGARSERDVAAISRDGTGETEAIGLHAGGRHADASHRSGMAIADINV